MKMCSANFGALMMEGEFNVLKGQSLERTHSYIPVPAPSPLAGATVRDVQKPSPLS